MARFLIQVEIDADTPESAAEQAKSLMFLQVRRFFRFFGVARYARVFPPTRAIDVVDADTGIEYQIGYHRIPRYT